MQRKKLDFGSGYNPKSGYLSCDFTRSPFLDYHYIDGKVNCNDNEFDVIHIRNVIHHILDLNSFVKECKRILKHNGELIIIDVNETFYLENIILDILWYRYIIPRYDIWFAQKYRNYYFIFNNDFKLLSKTIKNEKEVSTWKLLKDN